MNEEGALKRKNGQKVVVRNVACMDMRTASEETLAGIGRIENVATLLYSAQNAESVLRITLLNAATVLEAPAEAQVILGQEVVEKRFFDGLSEPISLVVLGQLMLAPELEAVDVRTGIDKLMILGQVIYPEHLGGVLQSKLEHVAGQAVPYAPGSKLTVGHLNLTQSALEALDDHSALTVVGSFSARAILPNDLLERKVRALQVVGALTCREENAGILLNRLQGSSASAHTTVVPAGFEPVSGMVVLDADLLDALPARRLYCRDLRIAGDVSPEQLDAALDALIVADLLVAPAALRTVLARKCNLLETKAVLYNGILWQFDDEHTLHPQRFEMVEGKITLLVTGELTLAADIEPAILSERVQKVHNLGEIYCTPAQMSALENQAGLGGGEFIDSGQEEESESVIGNTAFLKL
jgi:hypothetical protein